MSTVVQADKQLRVAFAPITRLQVRDASGTGDGSWTIEGYAAVFEQETVLWDGRWLRMREEIASGAFTSAEHQELGVLARVAAGSELVHLNYVHQMPSAVAASDVSGIGGLELEEDFHGLRFFARVDPDDPDAQRMAVKMRRGVVKQASFAFIIGHQELVEAATTADGREDEKWRITEIRSLFDVCVCPQGAYPQTESFLRSLTATHLDLDPGRAAAAAGPDHRDGDPSGGTPIAPPPAAGAGKPTALELARLRAHASVATRSRLRRPS